MPDFIKLWLSQTLLQSLPQTYLCLVSAAISFNLLASVYADTNISNILYILHMLQSANNIADKKIHIESFICHVHQLNENQLAHVAKKSTSCRHAAEALSAPSYSNQRSLFLAVSSLWGPCVQCFMTSLLALRPENSINPALQRYDGLTG